MRKLFVGCFSATIIALISLSPVQADAPSLIISAIKTDGSAAAEYVELANVGTDPVTIATNTWSLEYAKPVTTAGYTFTYPDCASQIWQSSTIRTVSATTVVPNGRISLPIPMNDDVGGAVRLIETDAEGSQTIHDVVGWGSMTSLPTCAETTQAAIAKANQVLTRCLVDGLPSDTNNNAADMRVIQTADPIPDCEPPSTDPPSQAKYCLGAEITEILPDPAGDTGNNGEFVELHNPTTLPIPLKDCQLYVGSTYSQHAALPDTELAPDQYQAFTFEDTGLQLSNTHGRAKVMSADSATIFSETDPYTAVPEGFSWALINGNWQITQKPTPDVANELVVPDPGVGGGEVITNEPCPDGKFRNPDTNRCKTVVVTASDVVSCAADQERNPDTNRCRKVSALTSTLTPCQPDQERNPITNRCRKITTAEAALTPCQAGYERNPDTNRCRKAAPAVPANSNNNTSKQPFSVAGLPVNMSWLAVGALSAGAAGYGAYEWRYEFGKALQLVRRKLFGSQTNED